MTKWIFEWTEFHFCDTYLKNEADSKHNHINQSRVHLLCELMHLCEKNENNI